ncbi:MAG: hypothetical protein DMG96_13995 [Acidobacteria bacterium]|nr:MAG: hypothetical protein DMG96_13995 [Acidobacteriota bacterium]
MPGEKAETNRDAYSPFLAYSLNTLVNAQDAMGEQKHLGGHSRVLRPALRGDHSRHSTAGAIPYRPPIIII